MFVIYLVWIVTTEGTYSIDYREQMDANIIKQREAILSEHSGVEEGSVKTEGEHSEGAKEESHH